MTFSIIVPIYNGVKYIPRLLEMAQKNKNSLPQESDLELIFVNDSPEISIDLKGFEYSNIKVNVIVNEKNLGIHYSRIEGIKNASGQWILMLDQDDEIADDYFLSQSKKAKRYSDLVVANGVNELENGEKMLYKYWPMQWTVKRTLFYVLFDCRIVSPGQCLIRKSAIPNEWLENVMQNNGADDMLLWLMMLNKKAGIMLNTAPIYRHCNTNHNLSLNTQKMLLSQKELVEICEKTKCVKESTALMLKSRIGYSANENNDLLWRILSKIQNLGERINAKK